MGYRPVMAIARFQDLCIDAVDVPVIERFWSRVLGLRMTGSDDSTRLVGVRPQDTVWINRVPEPKTVKNRVHLDIFARTIADLEGLGATEIQKFDRWTVLKDPEGGEFCAFPRDDLPDRRLKDVVVDASDPEALSTWWRGILGGVLGGHPVHPWWWLDEIEGAPFESIDFVAVPEPKTAKNRVHWDVSAPAWRPLLDAGATVLRAKGGDIGWHVLADPEGNEFCLFDD